MPHLTFPISPERAMVLRRGWKIGRGQRVVLVPGRIDPTKGQSLIVEVARVLTNGGLRGVTFVLAPVSTIQSLTCPHHAER